MQKNHEMTLEKLDALEKVYAELCAFGGLLQGLDGIDAHVRDGLAFFVSDMCDQVQHVLASNP